LGNDIWLFLQSPGPAAPDAASGVLPKYWRELKQYNEGKAKIGPLPSGAGPGQVAFKICHIPSGLCRSLVVSWLALIYSECEEFFPEMEGHRVLCPPWTLLAVLLQNETISGNRGSSPDEAARRTAS
jgi:hypothetical protein